MRIDLHSHSSVSDGTDSPESVIDHAVAAGLDVLALTDHDTVAGHAAAAARLPAGFTLVPGMELSCAYRGASVHLLGYLFDPASAELAAELRRIREDRVVRARGMVELLRGAGIGVTWEQVREIAGDVAGDDVVGRPHIARALVAVGAAADVQDAFDRWIGSGGPAYVARYALDPVRAVRLVRAAGGVCVLAHPARGEGALTGAVPDDLVRRMAEAGLGGIEADHPAHDAAECAYWRERAAEFGLVVTGSSDDHGALTGHRLGCRTTDPDAYARLMAPATGAVPIVGH
ncbi:PHP domain-containing protein [Marinitenerispora sediminis]|uniref:Phosphatase n=1 Tax=Marinitenerispora sediminis TaxID=1931232 RepID=A0A368SZU0_9ACTN|nr:PHP domain-containing protein [Marinitenerispora sediminis]RCV50538.1 phosphatase [Marinitenerispora sediminis]RCV51745.1 phosphatase [Marinitenerispora sediminis]RCV59386.1 phosphatase [Marinitenerispora sediminis]